MQTTDESLGNEINILYITLLILLSRISACLLTCEIGLYSFLMLSLTNFCTRIMLFLMNFQMLSYFLLSGRMLKQGLLFDP